MTLNEIKELLTDKLNITMTTAHFIIDDYKYNKQDLIDLLIRLNIINEPKKCKIKVKYYMVDCGLYEAKIECLEVDGKKYGESIKIFKLNDIMVSTIFNNCIDIDNLKNNVKIIIDKAKEYVNNMRNFPKEEIVEF